jgi:hypothetical protein
LSHNKWLILEELVHKRLGTATVKGRRKQTKSLAYLCRRISSTKRAWAHRQVHKHIVLQIGKHLLLEEKSFANEKAQTPDKQKGEKKELNRLGASPDLAFTHKTLTIGVLPCKLASACS